MYPPAEAPYPIEHGQLLACPSCRAALEQWPKAKRKCPGCREWIYPKRRLVSQHFVLCNDAQREAIDQEWQLHNARALADQAVQKLGAVVSGLGKSDSQIRLDSFEDLLSYAIRLGYPSWPELATRVARIQIERDAEYRASTALKYKFIACTRAPCSYAKGLDQTVKSAQEWYADAPQKRLDCAACSCTLEMLIELEGIAPAAE